MQRSIAPSDISPQSFPLTKTSYIFSRKSPQHLLASALKIFPQNKLLRKPFLYFLEKAPLIFRKRSVLVFGERYIQNLSIFRTLVYSKPIAYTAQKLKFSIKDFCGLCEPNPQFPADLVTLTEEILNVKLHFLCSDIQNTVKHLRWKVLQEIATQRSFQPHLPKPFPKEIPKKHAR